MVRSSGERLVDKPNKRWLALLAWVEYRCHDFVRNMLAGITAHAYLFHIVGYWYVSPTLLVFLATQNAKQS